MTFYSRSPVRFGTVSMVTLTLGVNDPEIGTVCREGDEQYIFVFNSGNSVINPGNCATVSGTTNYSVTVSTVVDTDMIIGVCKHATFATSAFGWLMQRGFTAINASAAIAINPGDKVYPATNGFFTNVVVSAATTGYGFPVGKCVASAASASTVGAAYIMV